MAKKKPNEPIPKTGDEQTGRYSVELDMDPVFRRSLRLLVAALGTTIPNFVNDRIRSIVQSELDNIMRDVGYTKIH